MSKWAISAQVSEQTKMFFFPFFPVELNVIIDSNGESGLCNDTHGHTVFLSL